MPRAGCPAPGRAAGWPATLRACCTEAGHAAAGPRPGWAHRHIREQGPASTMTTGSSKGRRVATLRTQGSLATAWAPAWLPPLTHMLLRRQPRAVGGICGLLLQAAVLLLARAGRAPRKATAGALHDAEAKGPCQTRGPPVQALGDSLGCAPRPLPPIPCWRPCRYHQPRRHRRHRWHPECGCCSTAALAPLYATSLQIAAL
eukprot:COSAG02_NODE_1546_length_11977_cov_3.458586_10_plen_202_part_00